MHWDVHESLVTLLPLRTDANAVAVKKAVLKSIVQAVVLILLQKNCLEQVKLHLTFLVNQKKVTKKRKK